MKRRRAVLPMALALIALPALVVATTAAKYYVDQRDDAYLHAFGRRGYVIHVPPSYDPKKPTALVLSFHGAGLWGAAQQALSRWDEVADREGFIVVYPSAGREGGLRVWRVIPAIDRKAPWSDTTVRMLPADVYSVQALIDALKKKYNIDEQRIYANGLSNGGGMAWLLSCTLHHRIAAVGMVGAAYTISTEWCANRPPVPAIMFHGTADRQTRYDGGKVWLAPRAFPSIPAVAREWARRNKCSSQHADSSVADDVVRLAWRDCDADVVFYTIVGGGHTWPGGRGLPEWFVGRTSQSIDASATMWEFFKRHELSR